MPVENLDEAALACVRIAGMLERSAVMEQRDALDDDAIHVPQIRFAQALINQRIRPALSAAWAADPVHVAVFGSTNTGKSTIVNVLLGRDAAGMSFFARYSQHPEGFRTKALGSRCLDDFPSRFAGYRRYHNQRPPRQADSQALRREGYRPALATHDLEPSGACPLPSWAGQAVLWDCPDFSTEEAQAYMSAVLDTAALADLVLLALTKESYADDRGKRLRGLLGAAGTRMLGIANKLDGEPELLRDIRATLAEPGHAGRIAADRVHPLPLVPGDEAARLQRLLASQEAAALQQAITSEVAPGARLKAESLIGAVQFLEERTEDLLAPLTAEVRVAETWASLVTRTAEREIFERYRRDYLNGTRYGDFNLAILKLLNLLEIPGVGKVLAGAAALLRQPFAWVLRGVKGLLSSRKAQPKPPEEEVVFEAYERWLDCLKAEVQQLRERERHPAWQHLAQLLDRQTFLTELAKELAPAYLRHRDAMNVVLEQRVRAIWSFIEQRPAVRISLQTAKGILDGGTTLAAVLTGGLDLTDLLIGPAVAPMLRLTLELIGEQFMEQQQRAFKEEQLAALRQAVNESLVRRMLLQFPGTVSQEEIDALRKDLDLVKQAARQVAKEAAP
jgi:hypothetical protein